MFKNIRNKIQLLNMVMVSSVVIVAFALIFVTEYLRIRSEISDKLQRFGAIVHSVYSGSVSVAGEFAYEPDLEFAYLEPVMTESAQRVSPNAGLSFSVITDGDSNLIQIDSMLELRPESYARMAKLASTEQKPGAVLDIEGRLWQYAVSPVSFESYGGIAGTAGFARSVRFGAESGEFRYIRFLDVTDSYRTIRSLALMLSGGGLAVLAMFFFISRFFANRAIRPMKDAWEKQSKFIADASHELKTPLSIISANCDVLLSDRDGIAMSQSKWIDNISRATDRMAGLVSSMLSLAGMEDSQPEPDVARFDFSEEVAAAADEMEAAALRKGLTVTRDIGPSIAVSSDCGQIRKIISILMDNAAKYADEGGKVSISLHAEKRGAVFAIRNTGPGIPEDDIPRVFDRFYRSDPARSSENGGYGLGLSIAKAIADTLGAALTIESGAGSTEAKMVVPI